VQESSGCWCVQGKKERQKEKTCWEKTTSTRFLGVDLQSSLFFFPLMISHLSPSLSSTLAFMLCRNYLVVGVFKKRRRGKKQKTCWDIDKKPNFWGNCLVIGSSKKKKHVGGHEKL